MQPPYPYATLIETVDQLMLYHDYVRAHSPKGTNLQWITQYAGQRAPAGGLPALLGQLSPIRTQHNPLRGTVKETYDKFFADSLLLPLDALLHPKKYPEYCL